MKTTKQCTIADAVKWLKDGNAIEYDGGSNGLPFIRKLFILSGASKKAANLIKGLFPFYWICPKIEIDGSFTTDRLLIKLSQIKDESPTPTDPTCKENLQVETTSNRSEIPNSSLESSEKECTCRTMHESSDCKRFKKCVIPSLKETVEQVKGDLKTLNALSEVYSLLGDIKPVNESESGWKRIKEVRQKIAEAIDFQSQSNTSVMEAENAKLKSALELMLKHSEAYPDIQDRYNAKMNALKVLSTHTNNK